MRPSLSGCGPRCPTPWVVSEHACPEHVGDQHPCDMGPSCKELDKTWSWRQSAPRRISRLGEEGGENDSRSVNSGAILELLNAFIDKVEEKAPDAQ